MPAAGTEAILEVAYLSQAVPSLSTGDLRDVLARSREKNARVGVTGLLLHAEGSFLQVLEGDPGAVESLYEVIRRDPRHEAVVRIATERRAARSFAQWTMGYVEVTAEKALPGFNDFFRAGFRNTHYTPSLATKVRDLALHFRHDRARGYVQSG